jgi:metal-responsive CopG/Arc/MetJ family transcriptional regulator
MRQKTSITLSPDVLAKVDRLAGSKYSRSAFIEHVLRQYLRRAARDFAETRDVKRINAAAEQLNAEAADVLGYQVLDD